MAAISESLLLYALVGGGLLVILVLAVLFTRKSWVRAVELGYTNKQLMNVVKSSVSSSIVPSIAIVIGFFSLAALLGIPWPWFRLSVIGSVSYEIMAANMAMTTSGTEIATATATDFTLIMYVMTFCIMGGLIASLFIVKPIQTGTMNLRQKDQRWGSLAGSTFMLTVMAVLTVPMILTGGAYLATWLTSAVVALVLSVLIKRFKLTWLTNFTLAISLLLAMVSSVFWDGLFAK